MARLPCYEIPLNIINLQIRKDTSCMQDLKALVKEQDETSYISTFSAMIHMEEAANSTSVWALGIKVFPPSIIQKVPILIRKRIFFKVN